MISLRAIALDKRVAVQCLEGIYLNIYFFLSREHDHKVALPKAVGPKSLGLDLRELQCLRDTTAVLAE
jgi:hypothetical protein